MNLILNQGCVCVKHIFFIHDPSILSLLHYQIKSQEQEDFTNFCSHGSFHTIALVALSHMVVRPLHIGDT